MSIVVSDTSPIRTLVHLELLGLLPQLFGEVLVPPAVVSELEQPRSRFAPIRLRDIGFIRIQAPNRASAEELQRFLDPGEAEAIALAVEIRADAILIDELAGRAVAKQRGLMPVGVLGILLRAKQRMMIQSLSPLLDRLQSELGFFISSAVRSEVLRQAGE